MDGLDDSGDACARGHAVRPADEPTAGVVADRWRLRWIGGRVRAGRRSEGGYALIVVLGVLALTFLVTGALLAMLLATIRTTSLQEQSARELRAADGALVAATNQLRLNHTIYGEPCDFGDTALPSKDNLAVPFDNGTTSITDDVDADVTCTGLGTDVASNGDVSLVGDDYAGRLDVASALAPYPAADNANLVHVGGDSLRFNGNVSTRTGASARNSASGAVAAVEVKGTFAQGSAGPGDTGQGCGVLGSAGATLVEATVERRCGDPTMANLAAPVRNYAVNSTNRSAPACGGGNVITLQPGVYGRSAVSALNVLFGGGASGCHNKTFHFPGGTYWFDANNASGPAAEKHALIFNDPTNNFVFGQSTGWSLTAGPTAANFPIACNPDVAGSSIVLSARTEIHHRAGRVAICPFVQDGTPYPALLQELTAPGTVSAVGSGTSDLTPLANLVSGDPTQPATSTVMSCNFPPRGTTLTRCSATRSFTTTLASQGARPLTALRVGITGDEIGGVANPYAVQPTTIESRIATFVLTSSTGATCTVTPLNGAPVAGGTASYELIRGTPCAAVFTDQTQLDAATMKVTYVYTYIGYCTSLVACPIGSANARTLRVWNVAVEPNSWSSSATSAVSGTSAQGDDWPTSGAYAVSNTIADDAATAAMKTLCGNRFCVSTTTAFTRRLTLSGFQNPGSGMQLAGTAHVLSLSAVIKQLGDQAQGVNLAALPGETRFDLTTTDGSVCTKTFPSVNNTVGSTSYSLIDPGENSCGAVSWDSSTQLGSLLLGASLAVSFRLDCAYAAYLPAGQCGYSQPVALQQVALAATTDTYEGPVSTSELTIDAAAASTFNVFGTTFLPRTAVDLHWNGRSTSTSIFGGELIAHSLGSTVGSGAVAGEVCCSAPILGDREVRLIARVDGNARISTTIRIDQTGGVEVLDWVICRRETCRPS